MRKEKLIRKFIEAALLTINQNLFVEKVIHDAKKQSITINPSGLAIGVSIFFDTEILCQVNLFNNSGDKALEESKRRGIIIARGDNKMGLVASGKSNEKNRGALKANGLVIATFGFNHNQLDEYFSWLILNYVERRLEEVNMSLKDTRFREQNLNQFIEEEKKRLGY